MKKPTTSKKETHNHQKGKVLNIEKKPSQISVLIAMHEISDKTLPNIAPKSLDFQYRLGTHQLSKIFDMLPVESAKCPDDLTTWHDSVVKELAQYIARFLFDESEQKRRILALTRLINEYKVVQFVHQKNLTISLHRIHVLLQDNFPSSFFCDFLHLALIGRSNIQSKTIAF